MRFRHFGIVSLIVLIYAAGGCDLLSPPEEPPPVEWSQLDASYWYTCALTSDREQFCWGGLTSWRGDPPELDSIPEVSAVPYAVPTDKRFASLAVSEAGACALDVEGAAYCWGANSAGELGDSTLVAKRTPVPVSGDYRWQMISAGSVHVCGINEVGEAYCWGNEFRGALGNGLSRPEIVWTYPIPVLGDHRWSDIQASSGNTCGITTSGETYCWGANDSGQLGHGGPIEPGSEMLEPSKVVVGGHEFETVTLGINHTCGLTAEGTAYCWGFNKHGQLGDGSTVNRSAPVKVNGEHRWARLSAGGLHTCGQTTEGELYCWGMNEYGQLGTGTADNEHAPGPVTEVPRLSEVVPGARHTCALTEDGEAYCWGMNSRGQLGTGSFEDQYLPQRVVSPV